MGTWLKRKAWMIWSVAFVFWIWLVTFVSWSTASVVQALQPARVQGVRIYTQPEQRYLREEQDHCLSILRDQKSGIVFTIPAAANDKDQICLATAGDRLICATIGQLRAAWGEPPRLHGGDR